MTNLKNFTLLLLCLFASSMTFAQIGLGVKAGVNFSTTYGSSEEFNDEKLESIGLNSGFQGGAFVTIGLTESFKVIGEVAYEVRNGLKNVDVVSVTPTPFGDINAVVNVEAKNSFHYINIPVLAAFGSGPLSFYAGPNFALLSKATSTQTTTTDVTTPDDLPEGIAPESSVVEVEIDFKEDAPFKDNGSFINEFDLGINVGAMFNVTDNLFLDLRINHGITDATNNDYDFSILDSSVSREDSDKNVSVQLSLGYKF